MTSDSMFTEQYSSSSVAVAERPAPAGDLLAQFPEAYEIVRQHRWALELYGKFDNPELKGQLDWKKDHVARVTGVAVNAALKLGLSAHVVKLVALAGVAHDSAMADGMNLNIINKNGPLTPEEIEHINEHPDRSADMVLAVAGNDPFRDAVEKLVRHHHDRQKYPVHDGNPFEGMSEEEQQALVILIAADAADAIRAKGMPKDSKEARPYTLSEVPVPLEKAISDISQYFSEEFKQYIAAVVNERYNLPNAA